MYELEVLDAECIIYIELFNHKSVRYSLSNADLGIVILSKDDQIISYSLDGYEYSASKRLKLNKGIYKILPLSFRYLNNRQSKFNLVIKGSNKFGIKTKMKPINYLKETVFKIFLKTSAFNKHPDKSDDCVYIFAESCYRFVLAYNNTNKVIRVETSVKLGRIEFTRLKDNVKTHLETNNYYAVSSTNNSAIDYVSPNRKKIIMILSNYVKLKKEHGFKIRFSDCEVSANTNFVI